ncbi:MAG: MG2 domain-containing protein [Planctomycetota bacterium]|nr:MG2 domain-containing protein [Planctomycetota bacterium]
MRRFACVLGLALCVGSGTLFGVEELPKPLTAQEQLGELLRAIAPDAGPVRPPFDLARHDMGWAAELEAWARDHPAPAGPDSPERDQALSERTQTQLDELRAWAVRRQKQLTRAWSRLKREWHADPQRPRESAEYDFLAYAFGETPLEQALASARKAGPDARLRLARLLLVECRFDASARELLELAAGAGAAARHALALAVRLQEERRALAEYVPLLPMEVDLGKALDELAQDPARKAVLEALARGVKASLAPNAKKLDPDAVQEGTGGLYRSTPAILERAHGDEASWEHAERLESTQASVLEAGSLSRACLETASTDLILTRGGDGNGFVAGRTARLVLHSAYGGEIEFRLYRFESLDEWLGLKAAALGAREPVKAWSAAYKPLGENNREPWSESIEVPDLDEGYYLLTAGARYAPLAAGHKFAVGRVALYLRAARNRAVVVAVDRLTGAPVAGVPVALTGWGQPVFERFAHVYQGEHQDAFRSGFQDQDPDFGARPEAADEAERLAKAEAYVLGRELRERHPDRRFGQRGATDAQGLAVFDLDLSQPHFKYQVTVSRIGPGFAEARVAYFEETSEEPAPKLVAWSGQPVYRPGERANLKGVLRRFENGRILDFEPAWKSSAAVEVKNDKGDLLWSGTCKLSEVGSFQADFEISPNASLGAYAVYADGQRASPYAPFTVEEFRLPAFELWLDVKQREAPSGGQVGGVVTVQYANQQPAPDTEVEVVLETGEKSPRGVTVRSGTDGKAAFTLDLPQAPRDTRCVLRATAMDASGESRTRTRELTVTAAPFRVKLEATPSDPRFGDPILLAVEARTWDDRPVAGAAVMLEGLHQPARTDAAGVARIPWRAAKERGGQSFVVSVLDGDRAAYARTSVYVYPRAKDEPPGAAADPHRDYVRLELDEKILAGRELKIALEVDRLEGKEADVALFVEGSRMLEHRMLRLAPGRHELALPTDENYLPYVRVSAVLFHARECKTSSAECYVRPADRFLTLELETEREEYKPGEPCAVRLRALDDRGRPVPRAEISLGVVNEQIYWLRKDPTPDLLEYFFQFRTPIHAQGRYDGPTPGSVAVWYWIGPKYAWGWLMDGDRFGWRSGGGRRMALRSGGGRATTSAPYLRRDFKNTAYWVADLKTDAEGRAFAQFAFPDNLTGWRLTARGLTADTKVGEIVQTCKTNLPLQVELAMPRALRAGDRMQASAVVHNNRDAACAAELAFDSPARKGEDVLELEAGGVQRVAIPVAPEDTSEFKLRASVKDSQGQDADAIERSYAALPRGHRVARVQGGSLAAGGEIALDLGGPVVPGTLKLTLRAEAGLSGPLQSTLGSLIEYPYGCVEQTMSRFMPAVIASRAMREAGLAHPRAEILPLVLRRGLERLYAYQHGDGGWGWWKHDESNDFMTAYVLEGLALCRRAGAEIHAGAFERAERYLAKRFLDENLRGGSLHGIAETRLDLYAARALAECYACDPEQHEPSMRRTAELLKDLLEDPEGLGAREAALAASAFRLLGRRELAQAWLDRAHARLEPNGGGRAHALALAAVLEGGTNLEPADPRWARLSADLLRLRQGPGWIDTFVSSAAVRGLAPLIAPSKGALEAVDVLDGERVVASVAPKPDASVELVLDRQLDGVRSLRLRPRGEAGADLFWSAEVEGCLAAAPPAPQFPDARLRVSVSKDGAQPEVLEPEDGVLAAPQGKTLRVDLACTLAGPLTALRITFPRPCGVEVVRPAYYEKGVVAYEERDDALHFFVEHWDKGEHHIVFLVRAEAEGEAFAPLPQLVPMYGDAPKVLVEGPERWKVAK